MPLRLLAVAVLVAVRLVALDADPPAFLSWSTGPYTDEGFYTLDARHQALFGHPAPGDFHDRLLSPLLSLSQQGAFALFGPSLLHARLLSVTFSLLTLWLFWLGLRRVWGLGAADWGALLLGLAPPFVFYNRLALQETPAVFWVVLALALWTLGRSYALPSGAALGLALVFKPLSLLALPAFLVAAGTPPGLVPRPPSPKRRGRHSPCQFPLPFREGWRASASRGGFLAVLFLYALLWYAPHHAALSRMATFYRVHQMQPHSLLSVWLNVRRGLIGGERGVTPYLLALMPVPCLLAVCGLRRPPTPPELGAGGRSSELGAGGRLFLLWLLGGLAFCLLSSYAPSRYYVLFLPALAALAARAAARLTRPGQLAAALLFFVTSGLWYGQAWAHRTYARRDAARTLARTLPPGSVVVGEFAPALCLDTPFAAAPVQPGLSNDHHPVERLHATHVAVTRTALWEAWWQARYPNVLQPSHRVATFTLGGSRRYVVDIYAVTQETRRGTPN